MELLLCELTPTSHCRGFRSCMPKAGADIFQSLKGNYQNYGKLNDQKVRRTDAEKIVF